MILALQPQTNLHSSAIPPESPLALGLFSSALIFPFLSSLGLGTFCL
ncbi:hypothetical protein COLO4_16031 [Corchorus olitorius]|uniref:Uncharacterized protein n=1 Tax=Corchorus olitorius TaxID=93759 RepID=A0A1R3JK86_9ROSI|nr:hypothetical protein COLO4_16031 [Corchorus olitorius]